MKCPVCGHEAFVTRTRKGINGPVEESYYCSRCFWDETKDVKNKDAKLKSIEEYEKKLIDMLQGLSEDLKKYNLKDQEGMVSRFEKIIDNFIKEEKI